MSSASVSIIVPVYNVGPYVEDCIRSVMQQTYTGPMECIIVDDCSTDNSMEIVERLITEYNGPISFKVLHHIHNRGLSAARNTGMDVSIGDYLFFLDSDDELLNNSIETLAEPLIVGQYDLSIGALNAINEHGDHIPLSLSIHIPDKTILTQPAIIESYLNRDWPIAAWNRLYSKAFIQSSQLRFVEGIIYEDVPWSFQIACLASSLYIVNETTYLYRKRKDSITKSADKESKRKARYIITQEIISFVQRLNIYNDLIHLYLQKQFFLALCPCIWSPRLFIKRYKRLCVSTKPLINRHTKCIRYPQDLHYRLPSFIAPVWEWFFICSRYSVREARQVFHHFIKK